jgi:regulator of protease activity HflC (stomatin/prohibitin superfamily)
VWNLDPKGIPRVLQEVGTSTEEVKEKLVRPMARTLVRDVLNELDSEAVYNSDKRFEKADKARQVLTKALAPFGVAIMQVILHEHRFAPEYETVIHDRKLAEQRAEQLKSETEAVTQEALRNLETARGKVASDIAKADGKLKQVSLAADAAFYAQQQNAEAKLAERTANAKAIAKRNEALRGAGGKAMVKLRVAEALDGKAIVLVPGGASGTGFNKMDVNKLIDAFKDEKDEKDANR